MRYSSFINQYSKNPLSNVGGNTFFCAQMLIYVFIFSYFNKTSNWILCRQSPQRLITLQLMFSHFHHILARVVIVSNTACLSLIKVAKD